MRSVLQDIRFALRMLVKNPGLAAVMIVTLGLAIGANTTVFSIVDSVLIDPMPYPESGRLMRIFTQLPREGHERFRLSVAEYQELRAHTTSFESLGAWNESGAPVSGGTEPARVPAAYVTASLLPTVGVSPALGRFFTEEETRFGAPVVVVISHRLWRRAFAGDASIIGRQISVDGAQVTVVGVMPEGFGFPRPETDVWAPVTMFWDPANPDPRDGGHGLEVLARLRPGVTSSQVRSDLDGYMAWSKQTYATGQHPLSGPDHPIVAVGLLEDTVGTATWSLLLLQGAVAFLLLIAGANIASVLLARADARSREMTIRRAVGAHRGRIIRQLLTECLVLGVFGAALGLALASWGVELAVALLPDSAPRKHEIGISGSTLAIGVIGSLASSMLFGLAPALRAGAASLQGGLQQAGARATSGGGRLRLRRVLVVTEIALAVILVVGCGLMLRSFARLQRVDAGFDPQRLITMKVEIPRPYYPTAAAATRFWGDLQTRTRAVPGVRAATIMTDRPLARVENYFPIWAAGTAPAPDTEATSRVAIQGVGEQYASALGIRVLRGRDLETRDRAVLPSAVMINSAMAGKLWPGEEPIGRELVLGIPEYSKIRYVVVGVLADIKQDGLAGPAPPLVYFPLVDRGGAPDGLNVMTLALRTDGDPQSVVPDVRRVLAGLDPRIAISEVHTMDELVWQEIARPRFLAVLLAVFAGLALLLAAIGVFGVMSHSVAQRTREIGIRKALGASSAQVKRMVLRDGMRLVLAGIVIGLSAAAAINTILAKLLGGVLFDIEVLDPWTFVVVPLVIVAIGGIACWVPAAKATRVDPMQAIRHD